MPLRDALFALRTRSRSEESAFHEMHEKQQIPRRLWLLGMSRSSIPFDLYALPRHAHLRRFVLGKNAYGAEPSAQGKNGSAGDQQSEFARGVGVEDGQNNYGRAENGHTAGNQDGGPFFARKPGFQPQFEKRLAAGVDPDIGVVK